MNRLLPFSLLLCAVLACANSERAIVTPSPSVETPLPSKATEAAYTKALSYFDYSTPDEWSRSWLTSTTVSDSGALIIQVSNAWLALPKYERRQLAEQLEKRWGIALEIGGRKNATAFITIKDVSGHTVGGSRLTGVWVEE